MKQLPVHKKHQHWVQTDRKSHEAWAQLCVQNPKAGALLHILAANVGEHNAVVVSQKNLARLMKCSIDTVKRALTALIANNWVEARRIDGKGSVNAYVINDRVIWAQSRDNLRYSLFSATVIISSDDQQDQDHLENQEPLQRLPKIGETQIPHGDGIPPPSQPFLLDMEPDLPAAGEIPDLDKRS